MSVNIRVRNGLEPDIYSGEGGMTEGDLRGPQSDMLKGNSGVVDRANGHCLVHAAAIPDMSIVVDPGVAYIPNSSFDEDDSNSIKSWEAVIAGTTFSRTLGINPNSSGQTRVDLVCVKLDPGAIPDEHASDIAELIVVEGTPGAGVPETPAFHTAFAKLNVIDGEVEIENADITDLREQIVLKNEFLPGVRTTTITSSSTPTPNADTTDVYDITALAATATIGAPTGTPKPFQPLLLKIKDNGTSRSLNWNSIFRAVGAYLPTSTIANKLLYVGALWNATDSKWDVVATIQE